MAALNLRLIFSLLFLHCYAQAHVFTVRNVNSVHLNLTTSVDTVYPAVTKDLTIECSIPPPSTKGYDKLVSFTISRKSPGSETFEDIVTVSGFTPDVINKVGNTSAVVSGHIDPAGSSYLSLEYVLPNAEDVGLYQCEAVVLDTSLQSVTIEAVKTVEVQQPTLEALITTALEIKAEIDNLYKLRENVNLATSSLFKTTEAYNGAIYYFSQYFTHDVYAAQAACNLVGGYLVEIDDEAEYNFIVQHIFSRLYMDFDPEYVLVGMTDLNNNGQWRYWTSGNPLTYVRWGGNNPNQDYKDCGGLHSIYSYEFVDMPCHDNLKAQFVCEKKINQV